MIVGSCLLCGALGLVTLAEKRVPTGVAALMVGATPLWLALLDRIWRGVRLRTVAMFGLAVGFAGVAILAWPTGGGAFDRTGILLLFLSPLSGRSARSTRAGRRCRRGRWSAPPAR